MWIVTVGYNMSPDQDGTDAEDQEEGIDRAGSKDS